MGNITITPHETDGLIFLEINSEGQILGIEQDALDLFGDLYGQDYEGIIIHESNIAPAFFDLKTRIAGDILQKFSNFRVRIAIVGDWSKYSGNSLKAFIAESNRGRAVNFASSVEEAVKLLSKRY